jgi:hypothetical protein
MLFFRHGQVRRPIGEAWLVGIFRDAGALDGSPHKCKKVSQ